MKFWLLILCAGRAFASEPSYIKISFSEKANNVQILGRVIPSVGALFMETSAAQANVESILVKAGQNVSKGAVIAKLKGMECPSGCDVTASRSGVVNEIVTAPGELLNTGDAILSILNPQELSVRLDVPARYASQVVPGKELKVRFVNMNIPPMEAKVQELLPTIGLSETTRGARLAPMRLPREVRLDTVVAADVLIPLAGSGARVPSSAVAFSSGQHFVIRKGEKGPEPVAVQILSEDQNTLWVMPKSGSKIKSGDEILAHDAIFTLKDIQDSSKDGV